MIALQALKVKGFRAYTEEKDFAFDNPAVFLFGENHRGKSSTLNAVEWCMFGNECIGEGTGIRERIDWEIVNRNMQPADVSVELQLKDEEKGDKVTIRRRWVSPRKDELEVILGDGALLKGEEGGEKLAQLLRSSFRDFLTTVYQHQEAIRAILTQKPNERNDAIDRLLGLSDYRNILTGVKAAKLGAKQREMNDEFDSFSREIDVALRTRESDLRDKRGKAVEKGLKENQMSEQGALEIASDVKNRLESFSSEVGLSLGDLQMPRQWTDLCEFEEIADGEIKRFRSEMPDVKEQENLFSKRTKLSSLREEYKGREKGWKIAKSKFDAKEKESSKLGGELKELNKKRIPDKEKELSEADAKGAVITKALDYLRLEGVEEDVCPVCGAQKPDLLEHLQKEWTERYEKVVGVIQDELNTFNERLNTINSWFAEYATDKRSFELAYEKIEDIKRKIGEALGMQISATDDTEAVLNNALAEIDKRLEDVKEAVGSKQKTLDGIATSLEKMQLVVDILGLEEKKKVVEQVQQSREYKQTEELKDQMAVLVDDVERIKEAVSAASHEAAQQKVGAAGAKIDDYFRRITNNPSVNKIKFSVNPDARTGLNSYEFKDQDGKDLTPVLSQGDLNAMALSVFLGMACLEGTNQPFGFVMLDDPSQSLGSEHKAHLVEILDEVLKERMVILSSMDKELQDLALSKITKAKTKYAFTNWTPERGPEVKKE